MTMPDHTLRLTALTLHRKTHLFLHQKGQRMQSGCIKMAKTAEFYVEGIQNLVLNIFYIYLSNARSWL